MSDCNPLLLYHQQCSRELFYSSCFAPALGSNLLLLFHCRGNQCSGYIKGPRVAEYVLPTGVRLIWYRAEWRCLKEENGECSNKVLLGHLKNQDLVSSYNVCHVLKCFTCTSSSLLASLSKQGCFPILQERKQRHREKWSDLPKVSWPAGRHGTATWRQVLPLSAPAL